jgi:hypothetical protein
MFLMMIGMVLYKFHQVFPDLSRVWKKQKTVPSLSLQLGSSHQSMLDQDGANPRPARVPKALCNFLGAPKTSKNGDRYTGDGPG